MTDIFTQDIKDLMKLATTDFDAFYKETEKKSKSSGDGSTAASSGYGSTAASSGNYSTAASSGNYSTAASSGDRSKAASSGNYGTAASSGDGSTAASSGYGSKAASSGDSAACSALGYRAAVKGDVGNLLMCSEYARNGMPLGGKADLVDGKVLKPQQWYIVENKKWVAVDFSDGVFGRVISNKGSVKKIKTDDGEVLFVVTDGEHNAHGKTIKQARHALLFKKQDRDVSAYRNMPLDTKKSPAEWAAIYHVVTGACEAGCKHFMAQQGKLKAKYTLAEVLEITKGQYGNEKFIEVVS